MRLDGLVGLGFQVIERPLRRVWPDMSDLADFRMNELLDGFHSAAGMAIVSATTGSYTVAAAVQVFARDPHSEVSAALLWILATVAHMCPMPTWMELFFNSLDMCVLHVLSRVGPEEGAFNRRWAQAAFRGAVAGSQIWGLIELPAWMVWGLYWARLVYNLASMTRWDWVTLAQFVLALVPTGWLTWLDSEVGAEQRGEERHRRRRERDLYWAASEDRDRRLLEEHNRAFERYMEDIGDGWEPLDPVREADVPVLEVVGPRQAEAPAQPGTTYALQTWTIAVTWMLVMQGLVRLWDLFFH